MFRSPRIKRREEFDVACFELPAAGSVKNIYTRGKIDTAAANKTRWKNGNGCRCSEKLMLTRKRDILFFFVFQPRAGQDLFTTMRIAIFFYQYHQLVAEEEKKRGGSKIHVESTRR